MAHYIEAFTTISEGTHNSADLAASLLPHARRFLSAATVADLESVVEACADDCDAAESVQEALEELDGYAAPFCHVEFHESDGALLGVWPCVEAALDDSDIPRFADSSEIPPAHEGFALVVNDHGNVTLLEAHGVDPDSPEYALTVEIWGVV